jgi:hypothetical protein
VNVSVIVVAGLSPARRRALAIADNKIAENAGWDCARRHLRLCCPVRHLGDKTYSQRRTRAR